MRRQPVFTWALLVLLAATAQIRLTAQTASSTTAPIPRHHIVSRTPGLPIPTVTTHKKPAQPHRVSAGPLYTITKVPSLGNLADYGNGLNDLGFVVGASYFSYNNGTTFAPLAFFYDGTTHNLGTLGGLASDAWGINNSSQIVGDSETNASGRRAFLYDGSMHDLGMLPGGNDSQGSAINNAGQIVGCATVFGDSYCHAFLYDGTMHDLGVLDNGSESLAEGINEQGQIVGYSWINGFSHTHAFLYNGGPLVDLGTLGGSDSYATAINDAETIVGASRIAEGSDFHAFFYDTSMHDLGTLGGNCSSASSINHAAQIVGYSCDSAGDARAVLYDGGTLLDLNDLISADAGWTLAVANGINELGQIAGYGGYSPEAGSRVFLLTPRYKAQIQLPINADGSSVFADHGVVKVKFTLTVEGAPTCSLPPATVLVTRIAGGPTGTIESGDFHISACQYTRNLRSSALGPGTYLVQIRIDSVLIGSARFGLL